MLMHIFLLLFNILDTSVNKIIVMYSLKVVGLYLILWHLVGTFAKPHQ